MVGKYLARSGLVMMAILAAAVALYWLRHPGGAVGRYDAWRLARRRAAPIRAPSSVDALQLRDDLRRGDLAAANSARVRAGIPELFGDVGMARLYLLDSERDRRGALFGDGGIAPSGGARDGLISGCRQHRI